MIKLISIFLSEKIYKLIIVKIKLI